MYNVCIYCYILWYIILLSTRSTFFLCSSSLHVEMKVLNYSVFFVQLLTFCCKVHDSNLYIPCSGCGQGITEPWGVVEPTACAGPITSLSIPQCILCVVRAVVSYWTRLSCFTKVVLAHKAWYVDAAVLVQVWVCAWANISTGIILLGRGSCECPYVSTVFAISYRDPIDISISQCSLLVSSESCRCSKLVCRDATAHFMIAHTLCGECCCGNLLFLI